MSDTYEGDGNRVARDLGLRMKITRPKTQQCPKWCRDHIHIHGDRYRVTLFHIRSLSFDFWIRQVDVLKGIVPRYYDVLSCVVSAASAPTDPDQVIAEYGVMPVSQALSVSRFAKRLQAFMSADKWAQLSEVCQKRRVPNEHAHNDVGVLELQ